MFHALTSDPKQKANSAKANSPLLREDVHPTFDGAYAFDILPLAEQDLLPTPPSPRKQKLMRLQKT